MGGREEIRLVRERRLLGSGELASTVGNILRKETRATTRHVSRELEGELF
jgi:hypothetical protein